MKKLPSGLTLVRVCTSAQIEALVLFALNMIVVCSLKITYTSFD
jgi:hypothetical protein